MPKQNIPFSASKLTNKASENWLLVARSCAELTWTKMKA
jgi:hypothetical protein